MTTKSELLPSNARFYIWLHLVITLLVLYIVIQDDYEVSFSLIIPFILFGFLFEILRLSAFTLNKQEFDISAGAAIILAAILLFNPLELIIFAFCYGLSIVVFPRISNFSKIIFNICETINVTFFTHLLWNLLQKSDSLLSPENTVALLITMFFFVFMDLFFICLVIALTSGVSLFKIWKDSLDWVMVSYGLIAFIGLILAAVYQAFYLYGLIGFTIPLLLMRYNMYLFSREKELQLNQLQQINELLSTYNEQLMLTLSHVIDVRDNKLYGHSAAVAKYAEAIGKNLNLSKEQMHNLKSGSLLHDIGKLGISEAILQKKDKLTNEEYELIKKHSIIGEQMLENIKGMENIAPIIGQHHEHFNGTGYPRKLKGENIHIEARVVSLCDALDTMLSTRPYKEGWDIERVSTELLRCRGTQFDPQVVEAFIRTREELGDSFFTNSALLKKNESA